MSEPVLTLGFSSCPNDTFMFHALVHGRVPWDGPRLVPVIEDIEALNARACDPGADRLAITKLSVGALPEVLEQYAVLGAGAALGRGVGPLVVRHAARRELASLADLHDCTVAIPGLRTTAWRLLQAFAPASVRPLPMRFDQVMVAVADGRVDAGLVIHEGRFTFAGYGLERIADLGEHWEAATGLPVPLGVIAAQRAIAPPLRAALQRALAASIDAAFADPRASRAWVESLAQELAPDVIDRHIALYVGDDSRALSANGRAAIETLLQRLGAARAPW